MCLERIHCANIQPDPQRDRVAPHDLDLLADSIRRHGVLRPVLLRAAPQGYVIVHGERRWRAAQLAGLSTIPALIVDDFASEAASTDGAAQQPGALFHRPAAMMAGWELAAADD